MGRNAKLSPYISRLTIEDFLLLKFFFLKRSYVALTVCNTWKMWLMIFPKWILDDRPLET